MEEALQWINQYGLVAVSLLILSCGIGAPVSQDLVVLISGFLVGQGVFHFWDAIIVCVASILCADVVLYHVGRLNKFVPFIQKILTPKRRNLINKFFQRFGTEGIFIIAFIPGVRTPTFLTAGIAKMPLWKFLLWDFLGMSIVTTLEVYLASRLKVPLAVLERFYHNAALIILIIFILIALFLTLKFLKKRGQTP